MKKQLLLIGAVFAAIVCCAAEVNVLKTDFKGDKLPAAWKFNTYKDYMPLSTVVDTGDGIAFCDAPRAGTSFLTSKYVVVNKDNQFRVRVEAKGNGSFKVGARCYSGKWAWLGAKFMPAETLSADWKTYEFTIDIPVFPNKAAVERLGFQVEIPQSSEFHLRNITIDKLK